MQMLVYMIGILLNLWGLLQTNQTKPKYACHCNSETLIPRIVSPKRLSLWRRTKSSADSLPSPYRVCEQTEYYSIYNHYSPFIVAICDTVAAIPRTIDPTNTPYATGSCQRPSL